MLELKNWLDKLMEYKIPKKVIALNFNLYECASNYWLIELIGSNVFDEYDEDWACNEVYNTREKKYGTFKFKNNKNWEDTLNIVIDVLEQYLAEGKYANKLKSFDAVGVGFVDGDIHLVHKK